jgi:hypothetical protein
MGEQGFDAFAHRAAEAVSRRGSLRTLGAAAAAAGLFGPAGIEAKKGGKKGKCKKQVSRCREGLAEFCATAFPEPGGGFGAAECAEAFGPCCRALGGCNAAQAFDCASATLEELRQKQGVYAVAAGRGRRRREATEDRPKRGRRRLPPGFPGGRDPRRRRRLR